MKVGDEILIKAKLVGLITNPAPNICAIGALAQVEVGDVSHIELVTKGAVLKFWIDSAKCVSEKK